MATENKTSRKWKNATARLRKSFAQHKCDESCRDFLAREHGHFKVGLWVAKQNLETLIRKQP